MGDNGVRIAIACEDHAHHALATFLTDQVLLAEAKRRGAADWVNDESLAWLRSFCGRGDAPEAYEGQGAGSSARRFYSLMHAREDVEKLGKQKLDKLPRIAGQPIRLTGHIDGKPLKPEAQFWRRVFLLFAAEEPPPDVLIVVRDTDGDLRRLEGLGQALDFLRTFPRPLPVVVAAPNQDAEAWFVAGFVPQSEPERRRLRERTETLSFNPSEEAHRLTAQPNDAPTDAKRVLRILVFNEDQSRPPGLDELPDLCQRTLHDLDLLERRGERCGLNPFLRDLRTTLVPLLIPGHPRAGA